MQNLIAGMTTRHATLAVGKGSDGKLRVTSREEGYGDQDTVTPKDLDRLGFDPRGFTKRPRRSLVKFRHEITNMAGVQSDGAVIVLHHGDPYSGVRSRHRVWVTISEPTTK